MRAPAHNLSPEVLGWVMFDDKAAPSSSPAQDLWGIGCMLAELLLGSHPFYAPAEAQDSLASASASQDSLNSFDSGYTSNWGLKTPSSSSADQVEEQECVDQQQQQRSGPGSSHVVSSCQLDALKASARRHHRRWVCLLHLQVLTPSAQSLCCRPRRFSSKNVE